MPAALIFTKHRTLRLERKGYRVSIDVDSEPNASGLVTTNSTAKLGDDPKT